MAGAASRCSSSLDAIDLVLVVSAGCTTARTAPVALSTLLEAAAERADASTTTAFTRTAPRLAPEANER
jgi:hypothetical protein